MSSISKNLLMVQQRIEKAAARSRRSPDAIQLVAVSKTKGLDEVREALEAGITIFGESYLQEAKKKIDEIGSEIQWHMIGHLQTNKAKQAVELFHMIQSVDGMKLAEEINKRAAELKRRINICIQVNLSGENSKSGVEKENALFLVSEIAKLENIRVKGLMTMPPFSHDPQKARPYFRVLRELKEEIEREKFTNISMEELSMGMSSDFEVAIEEGATLVRIGTAIFGERS